MKLSTEQKIEIKKKIAEIFGYVYYEELIESDSAPLDCDSLDSVEILMEMEEMFNISISDDEWEKVKTVEDIYSCIEKHNPVLSDKDGLLRENLQYYLESKVTGGLYGLTIGSSDFMDGLIETIKLSENELKLESLTPTKSLSKDEGFEGIEYEG